MATSTTPYAYEIFDSLPYFDKDLETLPELRDKVDSEIAKEMGRRDVIHPKVPPEFELFKGKPLLKAELTRIESHKPFPSLDTLRYQLPAPTSMPATDEEWKKALDNAHAQLEHQRTRQTNVSLLQTYGANAWRIHNYLLETTAKNAEKALEELKEQITDVNRERKNTQTKLGEQITSLEHRYVELISSVLQIEMANVALEAEIERLTTREIELSGGA
ncbi:Pre-mRNA-splicing factor SPF27 [Schizophyllum commune]